MKKNYLLFAILLATGFCQAQIVNIPDPDFKDILVNPENYPGGVIIDTNDDNEIQVSEALATTLLDLRLASIDDFTGLEAFTNLQVLNCSGTGYNNSTLDLSALANLRELDCSWKDMESLDVSMLPLLEKLNVAENDFQDINLSNNVNLIELDISENSLSSVDLSNNLALKKLRARATGLTALSVNFLTQLTDLDCSYNFIASLPVNNLVNLKTLIVNNNLLPTFDPTACTQLETLNCSNLGLTSLNLAPFSQLHTLSCSGNPLGGLDLSPVLNLESLDCYNAGLNSLDVSMLINLTRLYCSSNNISSLNLAPLQNLETLNCEGNQLSTLDLSGFPNLTYVSVGNNLFTSLDFSNLEFQTFGQIDFSYSDNLEYVDFKTGYPLFGHNISMYECYGLQFICTDDDNLEAINYAVEMAEFPQEVHFNSYCNFMPGGVYNTISGTVTFDLNNNGCDISDTVFDDVKINIVADTEAGATFTNSQGGYSFFVETGNYTVSPQFENPYFTITPASSNVNFPSLDSSLETRHFCISPNGVHHDVEITVFGQTPMPGFDTTYTIIYKNKGNQIESGAVTFSFDDAVLDFVSASTAPTNQSIGNLVWDYANLMPFESRTISISLNVNGPMETPPVNIDDLLNSTATVTAATPEETPLDNTFSLQQIVQGSFDPNDKTCLEGNTMSPEMVGDYLHYVIRFQNSGTAPAVNVVVKDMIDATKFDVASLQLIGSSHPHQTRVEGNKVEFIFENIMLPAEEDDEPGSHGFVAFKIKTKPTLVLGNTVSNTAEIFFDFNFPIVTNTVNTTVALLGSPEFAAAEISAYPNPTKNTIQISSSANISDIELFDIQGRLIEKFPVGNTAVSLDLSRHTTGIYFARIVTTQGIKIIKVIKE